MLTNNDIHTLKECISQLSANISFLCNKRVTGSGHSTLKEAKDTLKKMEKILDNAYIPLKECEHGYLYRISSRNLTYGVFNKKTKSFIGIRTKFDRKYLFEEFHDETEPPFGTAMPLEKLNECPIKDLSDHISNPQYNELYNWISNEQKQAGLT